MKTFKEFGAFFDATLSQDEKEAIPVFSDEKLSKTSHAAKVRPAYKDRPKKDQVNKSE